VFQKELCNDILNVNCGANVKKTIMLKGAQTIPRSDVERWIVCTPLSVNGLVTFVPQLTFVIPL
jgi:hypothetical protein